MSASELDREDVGARHALPHTGRRTVPRASALVVLAAMLVGAVLLGVGIGAVRIGPLESVAIILRHLGVEVGPVPSQQDDAILWSIRLPRVLLGGLVGGGLAIAGAALQG